MVPVTSSETARTDAGSKAGMGATALMLTTAASQCAAIGGAGGHEVPK